MAEKVLTTAEAVKRFNRCVEDANGREAAKLRNREGLAHRVTKINS